MIVVNDKGRMFFVDVSWSQGPLDPTIEFYDMSVVGKKAFGPRGQFVADYYARTLAEHPEGRGIDLHGGVPEWKIDAAAFAPVVVMARLLTRERGGG